MSKFNIILNITTSCNYDCSYCDVLKDNKSFSRKSIEKILLFLSDNNKYINNIKFFGGEPLLVWDNIKFFIDKSNKFVGDNYEIVTNTSLLNDNIGEYFQKYFKIIFFSIDSENKFDYIKIKNFINKFSLEDKIYFNLIISPNKEEEALKQFYKLYDLGYRGFNILPVYITKVWKKNNLENLVKIMKNVLDLSIKDKTLKLYGFQENLGTELKLNNNSIFIDTDMKIYYSDIVTTFNGKKIKNNLFLGEIDNFNFDLIKDYSFVKEKEKIRILEKNIYNDIKGQKELQKIMDYFSVYLNKKNGI